MRWCILMPVLESPGKVLDFCASKRVGTLLKSTRRIFNQTYGIDALWGKDELLRFWGQNSRQ